MRRNKILFLAVMLIAFSASIASALSLGNLLPAIKANDTTKTEPAKAEIFTENALTAKPSNSVYFVLKLEDTSAFLKWLASDENINPFMPLIIKSEDSNDILGGIEFFRAFATKTPLKSAAIVAGAYDPDTKQPPFFQMAFTVDSSMAGTVRKITDGTAEDVDFVKLLLGNDNPITAIAQTMVKAEKLNDGSYRIDNELFLKAEGDMILVAMSPDELKDSVNALNGDGARLFGGLKRQFTEKDFMIAHVDYNTLDKIDTDHSLDSADKLVTEIFDKPLNFECAFESQPEKFVFSFAVNLMEAMKKEYADKMPPLVKPVKGSYMTLAGTKSPIFAVGGQMKLAGLKDSSDTKDLWTELVRQLRVRFGISEKEIAEFFDGAFSFVVNDSVTYEGFKIPALYISQTGIKGAAGKIFSHLTKSPHFQKVQEGILQLDTSISPVSCLIQDKGETLGINFAELSSLNGKPIVKPVLQSLLDSVGIAAVWVDFDGIRAWIMDDENGVMALMPMAKMFGMGDLAEAANDILTAEYSVPSFSFRAEGLEKFRFEFTNAKINPENGIFARAVKIYQKFSK